LYNRSMRVDSSLNITFRMPRKLGFLIMRNLFPKKN
jgi:hypothetical protein